MKFFGKSGDKNGWPSHLMDPRAIEAQEQYRMYQKQKLYREQHHQQQHHTHQPHLPQPPPIPPRHRSQHNHPPRHRQRQQPMAPIMPTNEYEYVRREHGFDFMPPSQYVPSQSFSTETDGTDDPGAKADASELSNSVNKNPYMGDYDPHDGKKQKTPVVQGKPVNVKSLVRKFDQRGKFRSSLSPQRYLGYISTPPVPVEQMNYHRQQKQHSRRGSDGAYRYRQPDNGEVNEYGDDPPEDLPRVRTAYSYDSKESQDDAFRLSRYEVEAKLDRHLMRMKKTRKEGRDNSHGRGKRRTEPLSKPDLRRSRREPSPIPVVVVEAPLEKRSDTQKSRRRSKSRDFREPVERSFEDLVPLGLTPARDASLINFGLEDSINDYTNEAYYDDHRLSRGYVSDDPALRMRDMKHSRKSKGIFGRIKSGFFGEKSSKQVYERARNQHFQEVDDFLGRPKDSFGSDLSPYPAYQLDTRGARVPNRTDDGYYVRASHSHSRRQRSYDARAPPPDYMYDQGLGQKRTQASEIPFQTSRAITPTLRANPDQRQRYIPMNASMSKQYRSQHQGLAGAAGRESLSTGLQARRGIWGCG